MLDCKQRRDAVVAVFVAVVVVVVVDVVVVVALALLVIVVAAAAAANSTLGIQFVIKLKTIYKGKFTQSLNWLSSASFNYSVKVWEVGAYGS